MLISDIETMLRQDLFDPGATRWSTGDLDRAIDKAVDRYSQYYPNIAFVDMQMQPYQRTYPYPTSWNAAYPVLWIEKILYPLQVYGSQFAPPVSAPSLSSASGTTLTTGTYQYLITFLSQGGETTSGPAASITTSAGNQRVNLTSLPIASTQPLQSGGATNTVIGRNIYRTQAGGSIFYYLATLGDNTTTVYSDSIPDAALSGMPQPPTVNTSGMMVWPVCERSFSEYSNMYDSSSVLAAGGNMGLMGAVGDAKGPTGTQAPAFTLALSSTELPRDNSLTMRVFYATKQQLDANGSTLPEVHRDVIVLGACAYCLEAYQIPTNDNFDFQDGGLRDRIDDTKIPGAWRETAARKMSQFIARLEEIKRQRDFASSGRVHWGDVPVRYSRL
ncbi:MAG: hypothetical protein H0U76_01755 [Ktedonobacteraceae bacterium]|nr:hypothetical protein [Ktedonobacteraceae bacterium]